MRYSRAELNRVAPGRAQRALWAARLRRLWRAYLRVALIVADMMAQIILTTVYFLLLVPFAWVAGRTARKETPGWQACSGDGGGGQYG